jgi:hypothetical protein
MGPSDRYGLIGTAEELYMDNELEGNPRIHPQHCCAATNTKKLIKPNVGD